MGESRRVSRIKAQRFEDSDSAPRPKNDCAPQMFDRRVRANTQGRRNERRHDLWICAALPKTVLGC